MTRYFVEALWDDQPEGGVYGTIIETDDDAAAVTLCFQEMARERLKERGERRTKEAIADVLADYKAEWEIVGCLDFDAFVRSNAYAAVNSRAARYRVALMLLRKVRDGVKDAPKTKAKIDKALSSLKGAIRHADHDEIRAKEKTEA